MKKVIQNIILLLVSWLPQYASCQELNQYPEVEKVTLFTDRYLYIAGEVISFSAFIETGISSTPLSTILYAELITSSGRSMSAGKFIIDKSTTEGCITLPDSLMSGIYYLRAYTKYMRNIGPKSYDYLALKVVNPHRRDVMAGDTPMSQLQMTDANRENQSISIIIEKSRYNPGDTIQATVKNESTVKISSSRVSVVPNLTTPVYRYLFDNYNRNITELKYYPETRGATLTGILQSINNDSIISGEIVNLSITGEGKDFMAVRTDNQGRFFFSLPFMVGSRDIFIGTSNKLASRSRILVDNDYCTLPVNLPSIKFLLSDSESSLALSMAVKMQLKQAYNLDSLNNFKEDSSTRGFYGTPVHELMLEDYVQLPNLEEYFNELPGYVKVRKSDGQKYFKVLGSQVEMNIYDPLVLVDWVAIDHPDNVLSIAPSSVVKIEMINEPYIKGDFLYGGIISIISKRGNFAGINLPQSGIFVNYLFTSMYETPAIIIPSETPDYRNTIFNLSNPQSKNDSDFTITFTAPFSPGKYKVVLKGLLEDSSHFLIEEEFEVINQLP